MKNQLNCTISEIVVLLEKMNLLNEEINSFTKKWSDFSFGTIAPFCVCFVAKDDYLFLRSLYRSEEEKKDGYSKFYIKDKEFKNGAYLIIVCNE